MMTLILIIAFFYFWCCAIDQWEPAGPLVFLVVIGLTLWSMLT